mgnify:CR=1 FL=1
MPPAAMFIVNAEKKRVDIEFTFEGHYDATIHGADNAWSMWYESVAPDGTVHWTILPLDSNVCRKSGSAAGCSTICSVWLSAAALAKNIGRHRLAAGLLPLEHHPG